MISPIAYVKSSYAELAKVAWPPRITVIRHSLLVVVSIGIATILVGFLDTGLTYLVRFILE